MFSPQQFIEEQITVPKAWVDQVVQNDIELRRTLENIQHEFAHITTQLNESRRTATQQANHHEGTKRYNVRLQNEVGQCNKRCEGLRATIDSLKQQLERTSTELGTQLKVLSGIQANETKLKEQNQTLTQTLTQVEKISQKREDQCKKLEVVLARVQTDEFEAQKVAAKNPNELQLTEVAHELSCVTKEVYEELKDKFDHTVGELNTEVVRLNQVISDQSKFISERVTTVQTRGQRKKLHDLD